MAGILFHQSKTIPAAHKSFPGVLLFILEVKTRKQEVVTVRR